MKKLLFPIFLAFALLPSTALAQNTKTIAAIRAEVTAIDKSAARYKKTTKDVEGISLEGTQATYYASGKGLRKISAKMYGETYNATVALYYQGESLIFAFYKFNRYDRQIGLPTPPKIISSDEKRFYFAGAKMIKLLIGKTNVKANSDDWNESENDIVDLAKELKDAFKR